MTIADRIRRRREELGLSQHELAVKCGYSGRSSISKIEGLGDNVTFKTITKLSEVLGVTREYLTGWDVEEANRANAEMLADLAVDPEMLSYIRKLRCMTDSQRGRVFGYIDSLLSDN